MRPIFISVALLAATQSFGADLALQNGYYALLGECSIIYEKKDGTVFPKQGMRIEYRDGVFNFLEETCEITGIENAGPYSGGRLDAEIEARIAGIDRLIVKHHCIGPEGASYDHFISKWILDDAHYVEGVTSGDDPFAFEFEKCDL